MTTAFDELKKHEAVVEKEYRNLVYGENEKVFTSDISDYKENYLSFLSGNNFNEALIITKTNLKRVFVFEYEKRREILNQKLHLISTIKNRN